MCLFLSAFLTTVVCVVADGELLDVAGAVQFGVGTFVFGDSAGFIVHATNRLLAEEPPAAMARTAPELAAALCLRNALSVDVRRGTGSVGRKHRDGVSAEMLFGSASDGA